MFLAIFLDAFFHADDENNWTLNTIGRSRNIGSYGTTEWKFRIPPKYIMLNRETHIT